MIERLEYLIKEFVDNKLNADDFQNQFIDKYRNARDMSISNPRGDWTEGGFYSSIFSIADMYSKNPRLEGELDAAGLHEAVVNEVNSHRRGRS